MATCRNYSKNLIPTPFAFTRPSSMSFSQHQEKPPFLISCIFLRILFSPEKEAEKGERGGNEKNFLKVC
jgi:hypothetical protein